MKDKRKKCLFALVETITGENESHIRSEMIGSQLKSQMNVVSNERVTNQQISNEHGLK